MDPSTWTVELSERAQDKRPFVPLNIKAPASVDVRLDQLCDTLDRASHARPSRDLMVAALIFNADANADDLEPILMAYRAATHAGVVLGIRAKTGEHDLSEDKRRAAKSG